MATQYMKGELYTGCAITQRPAALSNCAMMSPLLCVSHGPPNPDQKVLPAAGPKSRWPVALSYTAYLTFTHCTYCVAPAAPLVSGGAYPLAPTPGNAERWCFPRAGATVWSPGSGGGGAGGCSGFGWRRGILPGGPVRVRPGAVGIISRRGADTSCWTSSTTCGTG